VNRPRQNGGSIVAEAAKSFVNFTARIPDGFKPCNGNTDPYRCFSALIAAKDKLAHCSKSARILRDCPEIISVIRHRMDFQSVRKKTDWKSILLFAKPHNTLGQSLNLPEI